MSVKTHVLLTILLVIAVSSGCATLQDVLNISKPSASLQGLRFEDITLSYAKILFDVEIENPYPVALPLVNMDYSIASHAKPFLSGQADLQGTIAPHSTESVRLPAKISYLELVQAFKGVKPGSVMPYSADVGLSVDTPGLGLIRLPIKKNGELLVPSISDISQIDWQEIILEKAREQ